jgi:hypothetical protein
MVSSELSVARAIHREIASILTNSNVADWHWKKLRNAKYRLAAEKLIDFAVPRLENGSLRIDILAWDSQDSRHSVKNPDEAKNLQIMYFHLFRNVMQMRWPSRCIWRHIPDENTCLDWNKVENHLFRKGKTAISELGLPSPDLEYDPLFGNFLKSNFNIYQITAADSKEMCLCQLADLFAGIACFSKQNGSRYDSWKGGLGYSQGLFEECKESFSPGESEKLAIMLHAENAIHRCGHSVSLSRDDGFITKNPKCPLNFWWYKSKSIYDKAPSKKA